MYKFTLEKRPLSAFHLKMIALVCMIIDHIGAAVFIYRIPILNNIGRIAFPLFAFTLAQSCNYTRSHVRLLIRLGIFALISEIPFDLAFNATRTVDFFNHTNIFSTLFLAVACIYIYERLKSQNKKIQIGLVVFCTFFLILEGILLFYGTSARNPNVFFIYIYILCIILLCKQFTVISNDNKACK